MLIKAIERKYVKMKEMVIELMTEIEKEYSVFGYNLQDEENLKQFNKDVIYALENEDLEKLAMYYEGSKLYCKEMTDYTKINKLIDMLRELNK